MEDLSPASAVATAPEPWQAVACRRRRCGSPNIFHGVGVRQLQRLFRRSGDCKAEQRAQLIWSRGDGADLTRALTGLRTGGRQPPPWLRAFGHLRIAEAADGGPDDGDAHLETEPHSPDVTLDEPVTDGQTGVGQPLGAPLWSAHVRPRVLREGKEEKSPERYLHRVLQRPNRTRAVPLRTRDSQTQRGAPLTS